MDVREYLADDGKNPYRAWLDTLDVTPRARIQARVLGGDKSTQTADVARAQESWKAYQEDKRRGRAK